jgi:hypothetical protein
MKEKFAKLIDVKSIVTFGIIGTVIFLAIRGSIKPEDIMMIAGMIITYFFTKKDNTPAV